MKQHLISHSPDKKIGNYQYSFKAKLGKGAFGTVYCGQNIETSKKFMSLIQFIEQVVAIKVVDKKMIQSEYSNSQLKQEIALMKKLNNENIVKFHDVVQSPNNTYIISEYCNGGDLREYLNKKKTLKEEEALKILKNILSGLIELMRNGIIHRDIKPANILLHEGVFKLTDFGFAKQVSSYADEVMKSLVGTPLYMSPQILKKQNYTSKCDIWSVGLILYEMIFGTTPWPSSNLVELISKIENKPLTFPNNIKIQPQTKQLIIQCLQNSESQRISWESLFAHPLISLYDKNSSTMDIIKQIKLNMEHFNTCKQTNTCKQVLNQKSGNGNATVFNYYRKNTYSPAQNISIDENKENFTNRTARQIKTIYENPCNSPIYSKLSDMKNTYRHLNATPPPPTAIYKDETPQKISKNYTPNNESNSYQTHSTNTSQSNNKKIEEISEFKSDLENENLYYLQQEKPKKLKRTSSQNQSQFKVAQKIQNQQQSNATNQDDMKNIQTVLRGISNQLDLIPSFITLRSEVETFVKNQQAQLTTLQNQQIFKQNDVDQTKIIFSKLSTFIKQNSNDYFITQIQVLLLFISNFMEIQNNSIQRGQLIISDIVNEQIKKNQQIQQNQFQLNPVIIRKLLNEQLGLL